MWLDFPLEQLRRDVGIRKLLRAIPRLPNETAQKLISIESYDHLRDGNF